MCLTTTDLGERTQTRGDLIMSSFASSAEIREIRNKRKGRSLASPTAFAELSNLFSAPFSALRGRTVVTFSLVRSAVQPRSEASAKLQCGGQIVLSRNWQFKFRTEAIER